MLARYYFKSQDFLLKTILSKKYCLVLLFIVYALLFCIACKKDEQESIKTLRSQIQNTTSTEELKTSLTEIVRILHAYEKRESVFLGRWQKSKILNQIPQDIIHLAQIQRNFWGQSFSANQPTFVWLNDQSIFIYTNAKKKDIQLPANNIPVSLSLSSGGRYITVLTANETDLKTLISKSKSKSTNNDSKKKKLEKKLSSSLDCKVFLLENPHHPTKKLIYNNFHELPITSSCDTAPVISEDGSTLYYLHKKTLYKMEILNESFTQEKIASIQNLDNPNKKISPTLSIQQVKNNDLVLFLGNSGNFRVYYYNQSKGLQKISKLTATLPYLFSKSSNLWDKQYNHPSNYQADAYFLSGKTKQYRMIALSFSDVSVLPLFYTPASAISIYLSNQHVFYQLIRNQLSLYNIDNEQRQPLPIKARWVGAHGTDGLLILPAAPEDFRILVRKKPFTAVELELISLYYFGIDQLQELSQ